jgi:colicin import membrane protein
MSLFGRPRQDGLLKMVGLSFGLHIFLVLFLTFVPLPTLIKAQPVVYTVSLMPVAPHEPEVPEKAPIPTRKEEPPKPAERVKPPPEKPAEKLKKDDIVERIRKTPKIEKPPERKPEEKKAPPNLQEALDEIRKKAALDEIQKRVARREKVERVTEKPEERAVTTPPKVPLLSTAKSSPRTESKLNEYYSLIWAKIKESWTLPENLLKETVDLEATIIIIIERDGKIRRMWFEKKSNNALYDQMAMRAIMKAEPLPPIPKELSDSSLEIGINFLPE